jgi:glycine cleavage system H protein
MRGENQGMIPTDRKYSDNHQWAQSGSDGVITVGITHHAQDLLGDLVFVDPPAVGRKLKMGEQCGVVESVKSASDIYSPVSGEVSAVNGELDTAPEKINQDAYGAWIFKLKPADKSELASLLDAEAYQKLVEAQAA